MRACGCANLNEFAIDIFDGLEGLGDDKGDEVLDLGCVLGSHFSVGLNERNNQSQFSVSPINLSA